MDECISRRDDLKSRVLFYADNLDDGEQLTTTQLDDDGANMMELERIRSGTVVLRKSQRSMETPRFEWGCYSGLAVNYCTTRGQGGPPPRFPTLDQLLRQGAALSTQSPAITVLQTTGNHYLSGTKTLRFIKR